MKLTRAMSYALCVLAHLADRGVGKPIPSHVAAKATGVPDRYLLKILKPLVVAGILKSVKGPNGGYVLLREPEQISILEIFELVDSPIQGSCPLSGEPGHEVMSGKIATLAQTVADRTREVLAGASLATLKS